MTKRQKAVLGLDVAMAFMQILIDRDVDIPNVKNIASLLNNAAVIMAKPLQPGQIAYLNKVVNRDYPTKKELSSLTGHQYFALTLNVLIQAVLIFKPVRRSDQDAMRRVNLAKGKLLKILENVSDEDFEVGAAEADLFIKKLKLA